MQAVTSLALKPSMVCPSRIRTTIHQPDFSYHHFLFLQFPSGWTRAVEMKAWLEKRPATCSWDSNGSLGAPDQLGCTCRRAADFELFEGVKFKDTLGAKRENDFSSSEVCFGNPWGEKTFLHRR